MLLTEIEKAPPHTFDFAKSVTKSYAVQLIVIFLAASLFYTLSRSLGMTTFRIAYSILMYISILIIGKVFFSASNINKLITDGKYRSGLLILALFISYLVIKDLYNPDFSWVTFINHPLAIMCVVPILGFVIGYNTNEVEKVHHIINVIIIFFVVDAIFVAMVEPITPKVFAGFVIPFVVFNLSLGRYKIFSLFIILVGAWSSVMVDYRALLLRIIIFIGFFIVLNIFKKSSFIKLLVIATASFVVYIVLTDLSAVLEIFQSNANLSNTIGVDTRSFLYEELFDDLKSGERITGRGFLGNYYSPYFEFIYDKPQYGDGDHFIRFNVEVGLLHLILKGGYIFLILYLIPLVYTVWKGLRIKNNELKLEYNICIYLLVELFVFCFENSPSFHVHFFLMFFFAGFVYNKIKHYENISNNTII